MGGRGNGAARNSTTPAPDEFSGMLGTRATVDVEKKMQEILEGKPSKYNTSLIKSVVNPEYNMLRRDKYSKNCAICTAATALQLRGYDVIAQGRDKDVWRGVPDVFDVNFANKSNYIGASEHKDYSTYTPTPFKKQSGEYYYKDNKTGKTIENVKTMPNDASQAHQLITKTVKSWGNGAYGEMNVSWLRGGAHSVLVYNDHGDVKIYDSQSHKKISTIGSYLQKTHVGMTEVIRLDNAPVRKDMSNGGSYYTLNKMFKRGDKKKIKDPRNFK